MLREKASQLCKLDLNRVCTFVVVVLVVCIFNSCKSREKFIDYKMPETLEERKAIRSAPLVLLGSISSDGEAGPEIVSHWDKTIPLQLRKITVTIEGWLRGDIHLQKADLYYYRFAGSYEGPPPLGHWKSSQLYPDGLRRIFFVRRDNGLLRLACDGRDTCTIRVSSGMHLHVNELVSRDKPLEAKIADILFTKGIGVSDRQFAQSLSYSLSSVNEQYSVPKLKELVESNSPEIRKSACECFQFSLNPHYIEDDNRIKVLCQQKNAKESELR